MACLISAQGMEQLFGNCPKQSELLECAMEIQQLDMVWNQHMSQIQIEFAYSLQESKKLEAQTSTSNSDNEIGEALQNMYHEINGLCEYILSRTLYLQYCILFLALLLLQLVNAYMTLI